MRKTTHDERAIKTHGPYAAAVRSLASFLESIFPDVNGTAFDLDEALEDLTVIIGHIRMANCSECNLRAGLLLFESACLAAIGRYEESANSGLFEEITTQVFIADGKDFEEVDDPLAVYAQYLRQRILQAVRVRVAQQAGGTRSALVN